MSTRCTPAEPVCGLKVRVSIQRRTDAARSSKPRGRVVDRIVRARQLLQTFQDGVCGPPFASGGRRGRRLGDPMPPQERRQQLELRRRRTGFLELLQLRGERGGHRGGSRRPGVYSIVAPAVAARRFATGRQRSKRLPAAAEPESVQQAVKRVDFRGGRRAAGMLEQKVGRPQQRHGGRPAVAGAHELDDEIERRRIRLGRQRERIAGLKRYAGLREHPGVRDTSTATAAGTRPRRRRPLR